MKLFSHRKRPVHLGPYPLESLPRLADPSAEPIGVATTSVSLPSRPVEKRAEGPLSVRHAFTTYRDLFDGQRDGPVAPLAPLPYSLADRADHLKAGAYFLDADMVGTAAIPEGAWTGSRCDHAHAVVILVAHSRTVAGPQPGDDWIDGTRQVNADLRAA